MYTEKTVEGVWTIEETTSLNELTITESAQIEAAGGKAVTLSVDGVAKMPVPGTYKGNVILSVHEYFEMPPSGLMRMSKQKFPFRTAILVEDGEIVPDKCIPEIVGVNYPKDGPAIYCTDDSLNGILVTGTGKYIIDGAKLEFDGFGGNDFIGMGAGILTYGNSEVEINDSEICFTCAERCTVHIGGDSTVRFNDCTITNLSPETERHDTKFAWQIGVRGTNRSIQLTDNGAVYYNNCYLKSNGWGVLSVDGGDCVSMYLKDCHLELSGPHCHGYGAFSIGHVFTTFDNTTVDVNGYPIFIMSQKNSVSEIKNGSVIAGKEFGAMINRDDGGTLRISDSRIVTGMATIGIKGSASTVEISNSILESANGVIVQLFDNDEGGGMMALNYKIPVGEKDTYVKDRDLTVCGQDDIFIKVSDMSVNGDFFNSTTELRWYRKGDINPEGAHLPVAEGIDSDAMDDSDFMADMPDMSENRMMGEVLQGAHNMEVSFSNVKLVGVVSSAVQEYAPGITVIDESNREQINHITQTPSAPVNNGVIAKFNSGCVWVVTKDCWLTGLEMEKGCVIKAPEGKKLFMEVNGEVTKSQAGSYKGVIKFVVE